MTTIIKQNELLLEPIRLSDLYHKGASHFSKNYINICGSRESVFIKWQNEQWFNQEAAVYNKIHGDAVETCSPILYGSVSEFELYGLVLQDLSGKFWHPDQECTEQVIIKLNSFYESVNFNSLDSIQPNRSIYSGRVDSFLNGIDLSNAKQDYFRKLFHDYLNLANASDRLIHGNMHYKNILMVDDGVVFIDFPDVHFGLLEEDIADYIICFPDIRKEIIDISMYNLGLDLDYLDYFIKCHSMLHAQWHLSKKRSRSCRQLDLLKEYFPESYHLVAENIL